MKTFIPKRPLFAALVAALFVLVPAFVSGCGGDDEETEEHDDHHGEESPECSAISLACHNVDALSDLAHTCHDLGHDNVTADCVASQDECIDHCESLAGYGGHGGHGGHGGEH